VRFHPILDNSTSVEKPLEDMDSWVKEVQNQAITAFDGFIKTLTNTKQCVANPGWHNNSSINLASIQYLVGE
jgi:hypothetical protein